jgi:hypothetical protein
VHRNLDEWHEAVLKFGAKNVRDAIISTTRVICEWNDSKTELDASYKDGWEKRRASTSEIRRYSENLDVNKERLVIFKAAGPSAKPEQAKAAPGSGAKSSSASLTVEDPDKAAREKAARDRKDAEAAANANRKARAEESAAKAKAAEARNTADRARERQAQDAKRTPQQRKALEECERMAKNPNSTATCQ